MSEAQNTLIPAKTYTISEEPFEQCLIEAINRLLMSEIFFILHDRYDVLLDYLLAYRVLNDVLKTVCVCVGTQSGRYQGQYHLSFNYLILISFLTTAGTAHFISPSWCHTWPL